MLELLGVEAVGSVVIAGLLVREATQWTVEGFGIEGRGPKVLLSIVFAVAATYLIALAGWGKWSEELLGLVWSAAWGAHAIKSLGNGGLTVEVVEDPDGEVG